MLISEKLMLSEKNENVVRIVVSTKQGLGIRLYFFAGMNKSFNKAGSFGRTFNTSDYSLAIQYVDYTARTKTPTLKYQAVARKLRKDSAGEELRVFYVALTCRQKLILSGI